ncbi:cytoplasmic phosphatidylinositol transfer protein 1-like isoform X2 [Neofelis nebulosa]|uniref:cytoplasmic phosphatidylinositol transfer protein 1-like isoform X2 n=1 Tax=Neofelis nebulosa TaxID=61452 RepID=UPI00272A959B|nr:cytoplasmic phosphatidylinositol transfer protein 1-like isoform X2 [Neofelis nebulosa]XP_058559444.1 cytoplasmic phosphatidylinositol transfer protein 1-like isoform X2 [Neofelis nebulosa]XP_058561189.1 cytoplasmic phosphatidylinositol transfer protein 1-like isoform X2 [Neofelis nebulosa]
MNWTIQSTICKRSIGPLWPAYFTQHDIFEVHPCWSLRQNTLPFPGQIIFHRMDIPHFVYPFICAQYKIGQLYMISKHSHEQSDRGEGVEVVQNEPFEDPHHGNGQFTEKRVYLNSKLPSWARAVVPKIFYVTEKAWNYYPYTITGKSCSFLPKFSIHIETKYEDNKGSNDRVQWRFICFQTTGDRG